VTVRSGIVLVGGEARRAGGREKYFFSYNGETFIERLLSTLRLVVDEIVVVAKDPGQCEHFTDFHHLPDIRVIPDVRKGLGPIGGIHAGAEAAHGELLFVVACDMPFVNPAVIEHLFALIDEYDAVIPCWDERKLEPLHAIYRRTALVNYLESHESLSLRDMVRNISSRFVSVETLRGIDPLLRTFTNINKLEDLQQINGTHGRYKKKR
jgi:molybdopterin-guanine dinucleotide biosynthesis protein A